MGECMIFCPGGLVCHTGCSGHRFDHQHGHGFISKPRRTVGLHEAPRGLFHVEKKSFQRTESSCLPFFFIAAWGGAMSKGTAIRDPRANHGFQPGGKQWSGLGRWRGIRDGSPRSDLPPEVWAQHGAVLRAASGSPEIHLEFPEESHPRRHLHGLDQTP